MSETQTKPRTVTASEVIQRLYLARSADRPLQPWRDTGRWQALDKCTECGHERNERRTVCTLCGASA